MEELHPVSPDLPEVPDTNPEAEIVNHDWRRPDMKMRKKKTLCPHFAKGDCKLGKICGFAHGEEALGTVGLAVLGFVKTQLCQNFMKNACKFGKHCERAQGDME